MLALPVQERFRKFIAPYLKNFLDDLNYDLPFDLKRITVRADLDVFKYKEDPFVWSQKKEKIEKVYQIYFDDVFISYLTESASKDQILKEFWEGFLKQYELPKNDPNKIYLDASLYKQKIEEQKQKDKDNPKNTIDKIKKKEAKTNLQKQAKELAIDVAKQTSNTT